MSTANITDVVLSESEHEIATIFISDGTSQTCTWESLSEYSDFAKDPEVVEYTQASHDNGRVIFCFSWYKDQAGAVAVWNCNDQVWEFIVNGTDYIFDAWIEWDINAVMLLHLVHNFVTPKFLHLSAVPWDTKPHPVCKQNPVVLIQKQPLQPFDGISDDEIHFSESDDGDIIKIRYRNTSLEVSKRKISQSLLKSSKV